MSPTSPGRSSITGLAPGTYFLVTSTSSFVNEIYDDIPCSPCPTALILSGTPVPVTDGATASGRNFALSLGGRVSGTVIDGTTSAPIAGVTVFIRSSTGAAVGGGTTNATGQYTTGSGLASGTYHAFTSNSLAYFNEIYDNVPCDGTCQASAAVATGMPIVVTQPAITTGINFALVKGSSLSGTVTAADTGAPLSGVLVYIRISGTLGNIVTTGAAGAYHSGTLPAGTYYIHTGSSGGYFDEIYDDVPCVPRVPISRTAPRSRWRRARTRPERTSR